MEGLLGSVIGATCAQRFLVEGSWMDTECLKLALSKVLGYGIIAGSMAFKVPQILKIMRAKSAFGISLASILLENVICLIFFSYNIRSGNPFSTFGDSFFVFVQNCVILLLIFLFSMRSKIPLALLLIAVFSGLGTFMSLYAPVDILAYLQASSIVLLILARIPQIWTVFKV